MIQGCFIEKESALSQTLCDNAVRFFPKSSQWTPHSSPVRVRYGVSVVIRISDSLSAAVISVVCDWDKLDHVIRAFDCTCKGLLVVRQQIITFNDDDL